MGYYIIADSSSMLKDSFLGYTKKGYRDIKGNGGMYITITTLRKIETQIKSKNREERNRAERAIGFIKENSVTVIRDLESFSEKDNIYRIMNMIRLKNDCMLITADKELCENVRNLKNLESQKTKYTLKVFKS